MKRILVVVFVVAIGLFAIQANAQVPYVQIYFDDTFQISHKDCPNAPAGTVVDQIYVVAHNFDMWVSSIEYRIVYPSGSVLFLLDVIDPATQSRIGQSNTGIVITWPNPADGSGGLLCQTANFIWMCDACILGGGNSNDQWVVVPHPDSGLLRAVRWPDNVSVTGIGMTALSCPTIPTEGATWGDIKVLYNE